MKRSRKELLLLGTVLVFVHLIPVTDGQCPDASSSVQPCTCVDGEGRVSLTCRGPMGLPRLTTVLREGMCGRRVDKFSLMESDVGYLPSNLFFKLRVGDIQVSSTSIGNFTRGGRSAFIGQEINLRHLSMRRCRLNDDLEWQMIGELQSLAFLDLAFNELTRVKLEWFRNPPPRLLSLILKGNKISTLESGALSNMHSLIQLDLSENRIASIRRDFFPHPTNHLIFLSLSDNLLKSLPNDMFHEMSNLRRINLEDNQLESLPQEVWSCVWSDLQKLDLAGNPFNCDHTERWIELSKSPSTVYGILCTTWTSNSSVVEPQTYN